jgi:hypothetical protein
MVQLTTTKDKNMAKDSEISGFTLPSNPADRKKIRDIFFEMAGVQQAIKDRREDYKGYVEVLTETYQIPKKLISKVAKIVFDHNYEDVSEEHAGVELIYEGIMESPNDTAHAADSDESED